jgi:hypothetical protein
MQIWTHWSLHATILFCFQNESKGYCSLSTFYGTTISMEFSFATMVPFCIPSTSSDQVRSNQIKLGNVHTKWTLPTLKQRHNRCSTHELLWASRINDCHRHFITLWSPSRWQRWQRSSSISDDQIKLEVRRVRSQPIVQSTSARLKIKYRLTGWIDWSINREVDLHLYLQVRFVKNCKNSLKLCSVKEFTVQSIDDITFRIEMMWFSLHIQQVFVYPCLEMHSRVSQAISQWFPRKLDASPNPEPSIVESSPNKTEWLAQVSHIEFHL